MVLDVDTTLAVPPHDRVVQLHSRVNMLAATLRDLLSPRQLRRINAQLSDIQRRMEDMSLCQTSQQTLTLDDGPVPKGGCSVAYITVLPARLAPYYWRPTFCGAL